MTSARFSRFKCAVARGASNSFSSLTSTIDRTLLSVPGMFLKFRSLYPSVFFVVVHYQPIFAEDSTKSCARARVKAHASVTSKNIYDSNRMRGKTMTVLMQPLH